MNGSFSAQSLRLGDLFSGPSAYTMPGFQRPYCWTAVEVGAVLEDILFAVSAVEQDDQPGRVFFLGTIVLIETTAATVSGAAPRKRFDIVDGQQRLITLTMLIAVLRDLTRADGDEETAERLDRLLAFDTERSSRRRDYRVTMRVCDQDVLERYAQQMDGCLEDAAAEDFDGAQRDLVQNRNFLIEELRPLDKETRRKLARFLEADCQVVVISTDDMDNAYRIFMVVNQPGKPLSRNDLLKAELIGAVPDDERDAYVARWEEAERGCGSDFEQFFSHVRSAFGNSRAPIIAEIRTLVRRDGGAKAFLDRRLLPAAAVHAAMLGRSAGAPILNAPALRHVRTLERLSHSDWVPPALLWLFERRHEPDVVAAFLSALDRAAYAHLLLGLGRDKRAARHSGIVDIIRNGEIPHRPNGPMALTADEQRNILYNVGNDLYARSPIAAKLLLLRLNDAMAGGLAHITPSAVTVEHILPQKPPRTSRWRDTFSEAQRTACVGSLGNFLLVSPETNKAARNHDFDRKVAIYQNDSLARDIPLNRDVLAALTFGPEQIAAREQVMIDSLRTLWAFDVAPAVRPVR